MRILVSLLLALCAVGIPAESRYESSSWKVYLEFDQMLIVKVGAEYSLSTDWGVKGGVGIALFGLTTVGYEIIGVYHISQPESRFQWDVEFGLPLAYFDVFEGNVVDWDPNIDDPYAGWAPGASLVWGYRFSNGSILSLKTGVLLPFEYQRDSGWRDNVFVVPEAAIQFMF